MNVFTRMDHQSWLASKMNTLLLSSWIELIADLGVKDLDELVMTISAVTLQRLDEHEAWYAWAALSAGICKSENGKLIWHDPNGVYLVDAEINKAAKAYEAYERNAKNHITFYDMCPVISDLDNICGSACEKSRHIIRIGDEDSDAKHARAERIHDNAKKLADAVVYTGVLKRG